MTRKSPGKEKFEAPLIGTSKNTRPLSSRVLYLVMALVAVVILVGGYLFYYFQEQQMRQRIEGGLSIVAQLKADQITEWRAERLTDADMLVGSPFFTEGVAKYMASPTDTETKDEVLTNLAIIEKAYPYQDILLTDVNGKVLLSLNESVHRLSDMTSAQLAVAIKEHKAVMTDFHYPPDSNSPHLDVVAPLFPWGQDSQQAIGAVVFCIDPSQYLYPLLQSSPMPSETAETLLVERDGDQVLFLNELRHQKDTTLKLRIPLSQQEVPAVMAVMGKEGVVEGRDYRGVEVLAVLKHIPDSPWYMVVKIDTSEVLSAWHSRSGMIIAFFAGLLAAALAGVGLIWQRRQRLAYQALYQAELETQALRSHFEYLVKYANDIILLTDENQHIVEVNDRALETYGYTRQEMLGMPLAALIPAGDLPSYQSRLRKIQQKGKIVAEAIHQRKDGSTFPVEVSGRTIKIEDKTYLQEIVRDITERKEAEEFILLSEQNFRDSMENSPLGIRIANEDGKTIYANRALLDIYGYSSVEELEAVPRKQRFTPESYDEHMERTKKRKQGEHVPPNYDISIVCKDGQVRYLSVSRGEVLWDGEKQSQVVYQDITERKQAEEALLEAKEFSESLITSMQDGLSVLDSHGVHVDVNPAFCRMTGFSREELVGVGPPPHPYWPPEAYEEIESAFQKTLRGEFGSFELTFVRKNGERFPVIVSPSLVNDERGNPVNYFATVKDITEHKRAEEALRLSEQNFRDSMENSPLGIRVFDKKGKTLYINRALLDIWGYSSVEELEAVPRKQRYTPQGYYEQMERLEKRKRGEHAPLSYEVSIVRTDGQVRYLSASRGELLWNGEKRFQLVYQDITERKMAEEERRQLGAEGSN